MPEATMVDPDLLTNIDLARRVVDVVNDHAEVRSVDVGHNISIHLKDGSKADRVAALYALTEVRDYDVRDPFTTYSGKVDGVEFIVFGDPRVMAI